jgi:hypothetical protein
LRAYGAEDADESAKADQGPPSRAFHATVRHGAGSGARESTTTSCPPPWKARATRVPTCPEPPGITIFIGASGGVAGLSSRVDQCAVPTADWAAGATALVSGRA